MTANKIGMIAFFILGLIYLWLGLFPIKKDYLEWSVIFLVLSKICEMHDDIETIRDKLK